MKSSTKTILTVGGLLVVGFLLGRGCSRESARAGAPPPASQEAAAVRFWTCAMHPQIRQPEPGLCPICAMELIPVRDEAGREDLGPREIRLSPAAEKLAEVEVAPVERKFVAREVRMVGKVDYDETRLAYITARVPGRLDRLYVDYTGIPVREGDHLVYLYSPDLLAAQEELIQAVRTAKDLTQSDNPNVRRMAENTVASAREKLRLYGLTPEQVAAIEAEAEPSDHLTIYSPMSGIVIQKDAREGMYVQTGTRIYTIADLSRCWVKLDAYESDLAWLLYGQEVSFEAEAYPGERFQGTIAFIDPVLDAATRTVKVRVNVANADGKLKPGMFVRAVVHAEMAGAGKLVNPHLAGKWISPMHPEIIKDEPGTCDVCGMPLVSAESLGYVREQLDEAPLVIPATAPLITGTRAVVYVAVPGKPGVYEGREILLGPRAGDFYVVREGLGEGEQVVVHGNFKIDSAVQIQAKPSMMNPRGGGSTHDHAHRGSASKHEAADPAAGSPSDPDAEAPAAFRAQLDTMLEAYLATQVALAGDDEKASRQAAEALKQALARIDMALLSGPAHARWMQEHPALEKTVTQVATAGDLQGMRSGFALLSEQLFAVLKRFGPSRASSVFWIHCPMAFNNRGARWIQASRDTRNPYFGSAMLRCGSVVEELPGLGAR